MNNKKMKLVQITRDEYDLLLSTSDAWVIACYTEIDGSSSMPDCLTGLDPDLLLEWPNSFIGGRVWNHDDASRYYTRIEVGDEI